MESDGVVFYGAIGRIENDDWDHPSDLISELGVEPDDADLNLRSLAGARFVLVQIIELSKARGFHDKDIFINAKSSFCQAILRSIDHAYSDRIYREHSDGEMAVSLLVEAIDQHMKSQGVLQEY